MKYKKSFCEARVKLEMNSNLAYEPSSANAPQYHGRDDLHTTTQTLADEHTLADGTPVPEQRCLEYQNTKLGRLTYFG